MKNLIQSFFLDGEPLNNNARMLTFASLFLAILSIILNYFEFSFGVLTSILYCFSLPFHFIYIGFIIIQMFCDYGFLKRMKQNIITLIGLIIHLFLALFLVLGLLGQLMANA